MISGRQAGDEWRDLTRVRVDGHDAGAVVLGTDCADGLVRIRSEEPPSLAAPLERDVDRRAVRQETDAARRWLGERRTHPVPALVEHQDVRGERVVGRELAPD